MTSWKKDGISLMASHLYAARVDRVLSFRGCFISGLVALDLNTASFNTPSPAELPTHSWCTDNPTSSREAA